MSAVEILQPNGDEEGGGGGGGEDNHSLDSNPDSLEDIPGTMMVRSEELPKTKSEVFFERLSQSGKGSPAKSASAIRRAASVTGASNEDFRQYAVAGHMSPTISSRRRCHTNNDTSSLVLPNKRKSSKDKDTISLPCMMTRPTPRENRACRKRIELSHRNHLDFPHDHYQDHDHSHHHHHHTHRAHECGGHSNGGHSNGGHSNGGHNNGGHNNGGHNNGGHSHGGHGHGSIQGNHGGNHGGIQGASHSMNSHSNSHMSVSHLGQSNSHGHAHATSSSHFNSHPHSSNHSNNNHSHNGSSSSYSLHSSGHGSPSLATKASHHGYASEVSADEYLTPLQRKDQVIRGLKEELKKTQKKLADLNSELLSARQSATEMEVAVAMKVTELEKLKEEKNMEIGRMQEKMSQAAEDRSTDEKVLREKLTELHLLMAEQETTAQRHMAEKAHEIHELREKIQELEFSYDELANAYEEKDTKTGHMQSEIQSLKDELERREEDHQDMYLAMFQKGKQCHGFEREEELENIGRADPNQVLVNELIEKLEHTESKLGRWQTIKTSEIYEDATNRPESEADARLRFLKDSLYHYIMDPPNATQHLRAMAGIVDFTPAQRADVDKVLMVREKGVVKGVKEKLTEKKKVVQFVFKEKKDEMMDRIRERRTRRNSHH